MNRFATLLTAVTVLLHSVLGCCAHAVQRSSSGDATHSVCTEQSKHDHGHSCSADEPLEEQAPCKGHECCRVKCQWLMPDAPSDLAAALLSYAAIFDADQIATSSVASAWQVEVSPFDALPALPLRFHLALGVLLI